MFGRSFKAVNQPSYSESVSDLVRLCVKQPVSVRQLTCDSDVQGGTSWVGRS